jgi:hypothetical protein
VLLADRVVCTTGVQSWTTVLPGMPGAGGSRMAAYFLRFHGVRSGAMRLVGEPLGGGRYATDRIVEYYRQYPSRRTVVVLDAGTGAEAEIAPFPMAWAASGARHPPLVDGDGTLYMRATVAARAAAPGRPGDHCRAAWCAWKPGEKDLRARPDGPGGEAAAAYAAGGLIYWTREANRGAWCVDPHGARAWPLGGSAADASGAGAALPVDEAGLARARRAHPQLRVHWSDGQVHWGGPPDAIRPVVAHGMVYLATARYGVIAGFEGDTHE